MIVLNKQINKKMPKKVISIRLETELINSLDQLAKESKTTRSHVITEILEKVLPKIRVI